MERASIFIKKIESFWLFVFIAILRLYAADTAVEKMASIKRIWYKYLIPPFNRLIIGSVLPAIAE